MDLGIRVFVPLFRIWRNEAILSEDFLVNRELQKLNKQLKKQLSQLVELKKQSNMMAGAFYVCIIAIYLVYLCRSN